MFQVSGLVKSASISGLRTSFSQAFAGEVDPIGVVDHPVEDRIVHNAHRIEVSGESLRRAWAQSSKSA
jgi:hypothetical protein